MARRPTHYTYLQSPRVNPLPWILVRFFCKAIPFLLLGVPCLGSAQMHKVEKAEKVTRAIGVYEWTGELPNPTSARLVPVSIFIDGQMQDAGIYLARPVPFVLQTGVVYSIEKAGNPFGTLNIDSARDVVTRRAADDDNPVGAWYGYGSFLKPKVAVAPKLHPSTTLSSIVSSADSDKPHFSGSRSDDSPKPASSTSPSGSTPATPPASTSTPPSSTSHSDDKPASTTPKVDVDPGDDDRPHMTRRDDSAPANSSGGGSTPSGNSAPDADDPDRPTLKKRDDADSGKPKKSKQKDDGGYVEPMAKSLNDDPDRPTVHRGKPLGSISVPQLTGNPPSMHQAVAISDAANRDVHEFTRDWESKTENDEVLLAMEQLGRPRIQNYVTTNQMTPDYPVDGAASAPPPQPAVKGRKAAPAPPPPPLPLANEQLSGYMLSYGGLPTFVYTAETPLTSGGPVFLTLVAQKLPSGEIQISLASVTDANHLNRTPWMRLVDAVDADASHRASLMFELRAQSSRQFALFRLTSAHAEQTFATNIIE